MLQMTYFLHHSANIILKYMWQLVLLINSISFFNHSYKVVADNIIYLVEMMVHVFVYESLKNCVEKGENASYQHFFPLVF